MKFRKSGDSLVAACQESYALIKMFEVNEFVYMWSLENLRTISQNKKMWPMLADISRQVIWFEKKHDEETWKHIITAAWRSQVFVQGIGDTLVVLPVRTSKLNKKEFSELIEAIYSFGGDAGVRWSEPALKAYEKYKEAA